MFKKKRKLRKYKFAYGKSPTLAKSLSKQRSPKKPLKKIHPFIARMKRIFTLTIILAIIIFGIYGIFFSSYFNITDIKLSDENIENEALGKELSQSIQSAIGKNLILIDTEELQVKILDTFPEVEQVQINKNYPSKLEIEFLQHPLVANVINESTTVKKSFIINSIGYAIKENFENPSLPYIRIKSDEPINPENPAIQSGKLNYILETITYFEDKFGMRIIEVEYKKIPRELHLLTEKNFYIWLDMQKTTEEQLKKLKKALVKLDIYNESLQYIDLRIAGGNGDKIIYKRR